MAFRSSRSVGVRASSYFVFAMSGSLFCTCPQQIGIRMPDRQRYVMLIDGMFGVVRGAAKKRLDGYGGPGGSSPLKQLSLVRLLAQTRHLWRLRV